MIYLQLMFTFMKIGLFSFGGGYAILAMIRQEVVLNNHWLSQTQFMDVVAISQMTPGPIAVNAATFIGYQKGGVFGALLCTFGVILPSLIIMLIVTITYLKLKKQKWFMNVFSKLRLLSVGLIAAALIMVFEDAMRDWFSGIVFAACLVAGWRFKLNPFYMLIAAAIVGMLLG
ncbi:MAG: chromate transporter [Candidatus Cloacimonetes bacterium HGW-Cloacimonetes-3]|jgi:chromate transporter|nr:MAG: chromate transporter [Candidatus Cloacimonetes bacterium HGW-Cloacimonetes-3]